MRRPWEVVAATLTTPPNSPKLVISVDPNKSFTLIIDLIAAIIHIKKSPSKIDCGTSVRFMINYPAPKVLSDFTKFMKYGKNKTRLINIIYAIISSDYKGICAVISSDCKRALALVKCNKIYFSK